MKLTKEAAVDITIELWTYLAETGKQKMDWDGWGKYGEMKNYCPLCEYTAQHGKSCATGKSCTICPFVIRHGKHCLSNPYRDWDYAITVSARKKYANEFLNLLKQIKEKYET